MILPLLLAFNLDLASVAFNKLLCDEQADARAHSVASGEEGFKHPWQIRLCDPNTVILNGQNDAIRGSYRVFHGDGQDAPTLHSVNRIHDQVGDHLHHHPATQHDSPR